ncbi:hypothetical protein SPI_03610 [Niveomyces insectorum RCEF 264]|uniref:HNH nuclease domain-containing protein n=1 Tax=Niveomyces insectorum RCEF 264 TaxID=1081102 RepID=A0A167W7X6_9HYPO|nr:hypothetical protein SPI_03610 [Niveomyces insectorum RCEF 264]
MASPLHHLVDVFDFSPQAPVFTDDIARQHAETLFAEVLRRLEASQNDILTKPFQRVEMVRLIHRFALTQTSKDRTLRSFFSSIMVDMAADPDEVDLDSLPLNVVAFTDYLIANFFLPLKASSGKTPQPTPASLSVPSLPPDHILPGSSHRLATLRRDCLLRDRHRCVVTRKFDRAEAIARYEADGYDATDDEGQRFDFSTGQLNFEHVEVAHILPDSLMSLDGDAEIVRSRKAALAILDMFDVGVRHLIEGPSIDRPTNALTLTGNCHKEFGTFQMYFEAVADAPPHTYCIQSLLPFFSQVPQPVTRTLFISEDRTIDAPLPRLLAVHSAVAKVLHMSAAGAYCDAVLRDTSELLVRADGSTNLGTLAALRLGGWWNGIVV